MPVLGRGGVSLEDGSFAVSAGAARAGRDGEVLTAKLLNAQAHERGFTVLHDLRIPGSKANIDHVVVAGEKVFVIDSKAWKPGFYWTLFGKTYRQLERVAHADKRGIPLACVRLAEHLTSRRVKARIQRPLMVIHNSRPHEPLRIWAFRPASDQYPGRRTRAVHSHALSFPAETADPRIVQALAPLLN